MNNLPDEYITGNSGLDRAIANAAKKDPSLFKPVVGLNEFFNLQEKQNKYNVSAVEDRTYHDGTVFASRGELIRWDTLLKVQALGEIKDLQRQVVFILQEEFTSKQKEWSDQRAVIYIADFVYFNISFRKDYPNRNVAEDVKGAKKVLTKDYKIKRRMFLYKYGNYAFFEVYPD